VGLVWSMGETLLNADNVIGSFGVFIRLNGRQLENILTIFGLHSIGPTDISYASLKRRSKTTQIDWSNLLQTNASNLVIIHWHIFLQA
jgi:hypothetical protein